MKTAKEEVLEILNNVPDDATLEDIQYRIYVRQRIERGLEEVAQGNVIDHEEVGRRLGKWLGKSAGRK